MYKYWDEKYYWQIESYLVKALRESNSEDAEEEDTDDTGGCNAENLFKLVALGRKDSARDCKRRCSEW